MSRESGRARAGSEAEHAARSPGRAARRALAAVFYLLIGALWLRLLADIDGTALLDSTMDPGLLALGIGAGLAWRYGCSYAWGALLRRLGMPRVPFGALNLGYARSWVGRYVPGKLGSFAARVYLAGPLGLRRPAVAAAMVLEASLQLLVGVTVGLGGLALSGQLAALAPGLDLLVLGLACGALLLLYPPLFKRMLRELDRRLPRGAGALRIDLATLARAFALIVCVYALAGAHWTWLAMAVHPESSFALFPFFWGVFCLGGAIGTVAFFAPAGLGVRESVVFPLLRLVMPGETAIVLLILARLTEALIDLVYWALSELQGRRVRAGEGAAPRIVAICPYGIGNLVMTLPALASLRASLPGHEIHLVSLLPSTSEALRTFPRLPALYDALHEVRMPRSVATLAHSLRSVARLRRLHAEKSVVLFPSFSFHYNLLSFLCGARERVGSVFADSRPVDLCWLNHVRVAVEPGLHDTLQNLRLVEAASGAPARTRDLEFVRAEFRADRAPIVGVHPGCKRDDAHKQWGALRFAAVVDAVLERSPLWRVQIFLGPDELELLPQLEARGWDERVELVHGLALPDLLAELEWCSVFLSNDSGLMHLATMTGCPAVIAIVGPSDPVRTGPADPRAEVLRSDLPCAPCHHSFSVASRRFRCVREPAMECLSEIGVPRVTDAVLSAMRRIEHESRSEEISGRDRWGDHRREGDPSRPDGPLQADLLRPDESSER